jgi:hypothetical protein
VAAGLAEAEAAVLALELGAALTVEFGALGAAGNRAQPVKHSAAVVIARVAEEPIFVFGGAMCRDFAPSV